MHKFKLLLMGLLIAFSFIFTGCQGNNSDTGETNTTVGGEIPIVPDVNTTEVTVILPVSSAVLTTNSQVVKIDVRIFDSANNPYSEGTITKVNPSDVLLGRDIGSFDKQTSIIVNGVASFAYTAPADLSTDTSNILFSFYHDSKPSDAQTFTMSIVPELNQTVSTTYALRTSSQDGVSMDLLSSESVSYTVYDLGTNSALPDADIQSMIVTSLNPSLADLTDSKGNSGTTLTVFGQNNISLNVNSNTKSGIVPIKVVTSFIDANGDAQTLTEIFSILILSGPPSAISLSYASTEHIQERAKFIDRWVVTVTDKYTNLVNNSPSVSMGMITGYTPTSGISTNAGGYLHYAPDASQSGSIDASTNTFTAPSGVFGNVDDQNDILVVYGTGYKYDASGKWDITYDNIDTVLNLVDDYSSENRTQMGFAVGNNQRAVTCEIGQKKVANVYADSTTPIIDATGTMVIDVEYDYYLVGKSTMLWVNLVGIQNSTAEQVRIGETQKITLRGEGLEGETFDYNKGFIGVVRLAIGIANTAEYYHNANFDYIVEVTGTDTISTISTTSMNGTITSCFNNGVAFVDVNITASPTSGGTISFKKLIVASEF